MTEKSSFKWDLSLNTKQKQHENKQQPKWLLHSYIYMLYVLQ